MNSSARRLFRSLEAQPTGGTIISEEVGLSLEQVSLDDLGSAKEPFRQIVANTGAEPSGAGAGMPDMDF